MVPLMSLFVPIVVSAVVVFLVSSVIHMATPWHRGDLRSVPDEDALQEALRRGKVQPGDYVVPHASSMAAMKDPTFMERRTKGPVVIMTVVPGGTLSMAPQLVMWFLYSVVVSLFGAYIASRALGAGADYLDVFRFVGTTTFAAYGLALPQASIWWKKNWGSTIRSMIDSLIYGLLTAGVFGWLWPR